MFLLGHACEHYKFTRPHQKKLENTDDVRNHESLICFCTSKFNIFSSSELRESCQNYIYIIWDRKPDAFERLDMFGGDWTRGCGYMYRFEHFMSPIFMTRLRGKLFLAKDHGWRPRWCWLQPVHALNAMDKRLFERLRTKTHHGGYGLDLTPTRQQWQMKV